MSKSLSLFLALTLVLLPFISRAASSTQSLDGAWQSAYDPHDQGNAEKWFQPAGFPASGSRVAQVPGAVSEVWASHGWWSDDPANIFWYTRSFVPDFASRPNVREYLRFGAVRRTCDVWLNGVHLGSHAGGENPFEFDVTRLLRPGARNDVTVRLVVAVQGGIWQHVSLVAQPDVRIIDAFARPDAAARQIRLDVTIENNTPQPAPVKIDAAFSEFKPAHPVGNQALTFTAAPGRSVATLTLPVAHPHLWDLNDPFLYTIAVTSAWQPPGAAPLHDAISFRTGFRDFRIVNGWFELNGRRIFLKSCLGNYYDPIAIQGTPRDMRWIGQDFPKLKKAGFNMMRFIIAAATPEQLDQADQLGILLYTENETSWLVHDPSVYGNTLEGVIRRDRNHPSLVMWGLLNETPEAHTYLLAKAWLPRLRAIDDTRLVMYGSGRYDADYSTASASNPGSTTWNVYLGGEDPVHPRNTGPIRGGFHDVGSGDFHVYPAYPIPWKFVTQVANLARDTRNFFFSETGMGTEYNLLQEKREMDAAHAPPVALAYTWINPGIAAMKKTWAAYGLGKTYPDPEQMFIDSAHEVVQQREEIFSIIRGQPKVNGYDLTSLEDFYGAGEGFMDNFRVFKPGHLAMLQAGWAPLRWCLLVNPLNAYADRPIHIKAALASEDVLAPGEYPATLRVSSGGAVVWKKQIVVHIAKDGPMAYVLFDDDVQVPGLKPVPCSVEAAFDSRPNAAAPSISFLVTSRPTLPRISGQVTLADVPAGVRKFLSDQGATVHDYVPGESIDRETIVIGTSFRTDAAGWRAMYARAARGAHLIFLGGQPLSVPGQGNKWLAVSGKGAAHFFFADPGAARKWEALPAKGDLNEDGDWLYHKSSIGIVHHPLLAGLQTRLMTAQYYGPLLEDTHFFEGVPQPPDVAAVAIYSSLHHDGYAWYDGLMLGTYPFHAGHFTLNAFNIEFALGNPAADRLLVNLVTRAQADAAPVAPLPAGFDAEMDRLGITN